MRECKTVKVVDIVRKANRILSYNHDKEFKAGICTMVETVLFNAHAYDGFMWLKKGASDVEDYDRFYYHRELTTEDFQLAKQIYNEQQRTYQEA